jgi:hypothetical protein
MHKHLLFDKPLQTNSRKSTAFNKISKEKSIIILYGLTRIQQYDDEISSVSLDGEKRLILRIPKNSSGLRTFLPSKLDLEFHSIVSKNFKHLKAIASSLKTFTIQGSCWSNTFSIQTLSTTIKSFATLTFLNLNFEFCTYLGDLEMREFSNSLRELRCLKTIKLNFQDCCNITNVSLAELSKSLKKLSFLTHLDLDYSFCE